MANGYVPRFMRPNPLLFPPQPAQRERNVPGGPPSPNDPSLLFSTHQQNPQCRFPSAFPADGSPNIIQRFWIRLFGPPVRAIISFYRFLFSLVIAYRNGRFVEHISSWPLQILEYFNLHTLSGVDAETLTIFLAENRWSILIGLLVVVLLSVAAWVLSPKGENQTIWRSTLVLSFASCYIMWAITFLAQWHPLIEPKMVKLRPGYPGGS